MTSLILEAFTSQSNLTMNGNALKATTNLQILLAKVFKKISLLFVFQMSKLIEVIIHSTACECDSGGSILPTCDENGICKKCRNNVIGDKCDDCEEDMFGFPNCRKCK